jgi:hypothetical protein
MLSYLNLEKMKLLAESGERSLENYLKILGTLKYL